MTAGRCRARAGGGIRLKHAVARAALVALLALVACEQPLPPEPGDPGEPTAAAPTTPAPADAGREPAAPGPGEGPPAPEDHESPLPDALRDPPPWAAGGVTVEPCPLPSNPGNGCLYLGALDDLGRGEHGPAGTAGSAARRAFWERVNAAGGIAGYDVDATTYTRDTGAGAEAHAQAFVEITPETLALALSRGTAATAALLPLLRATGTVAVTTSPVSAWVASDHVVGVGSTACADAANAVDHGLGAVGGSVAVVHAPGAFGEDAVAGAALAAARHRAAFLAVGLPAGGAVPAAVEDVLAAAPRTVVVAADAAVLEALATGLAAGGFEGTVVALSQSWDERLATRLPPAAAARLRVVGPWAPWNSPTPGHATLRDALGEDVEPAEAHVTGWVTQYPLVAALEAAATGGRLTPDGVRLAVASLDTFDSDGMLPAAGAGGVHPAVRSVVSAVDPRAPTGLSARSGHVAGPTARTLDPTAPCPPPP